MASRLKSNPYDRYLYLTSRRDVTMNLQCYGNPDESKAMCIRPSTFKNNSSLSSSKVLNEHKNKDRANWNHFRRVFTK